MISLAGNSSAVQSSANSGISPTHNEVMNRICLGVPLFSAGGAFAVFVVSKISQYSVSPLVGALAGASLALVNLITGLACKTIGLESRDTFFRRAIKVIVDTALSALSTMMLCSAFGLPISTMTAVLLTPGSFLGVYGLAGIGSAFELLEKHTNIFQELANFWSY